jgi:hypothetical protein
VKKTTKAWKYGLYHSRLSKGMNRTVVLSSKWFSQIPLAENNTKYKVNNHCPLPPMKWFSKSMKWVSVSL